MLILHRPNEQKLFYSLLLKYQEAQLENYIPDIGYSNSDYHHIRPIALTKTYSTRNFTLAKPNGHGRQVSRFTVISNAAETEQSYDPFKASRPQHLDNFRTGDRPKVTIHRTRPSDDDGNAKTTARYRQDSNVSVSFAGSSDRSRQRKFTNHRAYASRSSLASSTRSRGSGSHLRASNGYKRGVSFAHLRKQAVINHGLTKYHSNYTEVTDMDGDTLRPVAEISASTQYIRSKKYHVSQPESPLSRPGSAHISHLWTDDVQQLSSSLAKDCDEAFNRLETVEEDPRRYSVPLPPPSQIKDSSYLAVPKKSINASLDDRPLPPAPEQTDETKLELIEARKQAELRKSFGGPDSPGYLNRMVSHIDRLIQHNPPVEIVTERRSSSAPAESRPARSSQPLPSIFEARKEEESLLKEANGYKPDERHSRGAAKSARVASAPEPRDPKKHPRKDRFSSLNSDARATIRVVHPESPVKAPAPLSIRKKSSQDESSTFFTRKTGTDITSHRGRNGLTEFGIGQDIQSKSKTDILAPGSMNQIHNTGDYANDSYSGTILKKKTTWFKRNSKSGTEHDWRMSINGNAGHSQSSSTDTSGRVKSVTPLPISRRKKFSLGSLFKKRSSKVNLMTLGEPFVSF